MRGSVTVAAPAKVNLFLRVLERRADGFHEIETIFQAVDLHDRIVLSATASGVELVVDGPDLGPPERNLAVRAARAFLDSANRPGGVRIHLTKGIPAGAGLGGGSSDAAAVLRGLAVLVPEGPTGPELRRLGASLGADVAFFLGGSTLAVARGKGERLEPLEPFGERPLVLVLPPVHVATGPAYAALDEQRRSGVGPPGEERRLPLRRPHSWTDLDAWAHNDFETVVPSQHPEVVRSLAALSGRGGRPTLLSGSGAACFGLFADARAAEEAADALFAELGWTALATHTLTTLPAPEVADPGGASPPAS